MTDERRFIMLAGQRTGCHITALAQDELTTLAPATHRGCCIMVAGVEPGMTFDYDDSTFEVHKAWDEAARALPEAGARHATAVLSDVDLAYYKSRKGKFLDLLLVEMVAGDL